MSCQNNWNKIFAKGLSNAITRMIKINKHIKEHSISKETKNILNIHNITSKEQFKQWGGYKKLYPMVEKQAYYHYKHVKDAKANIRTNTQLYLKGYKRFKHILES